MSLIALPTGFCPNSFSLRMHTNQLAYASPYGGSEQVIDKGNDRWLLSLSLPNRTFAQAAAIEAFIGALRGMTNTVALYHWVRKVPRGTLRGAPVTYFSPAAAGDSQIIIRTVPNLEGITLLAGDMIGIDGLLLQVAQDCVSVADGGILVPLVNKLRRAIAVGVPVTWDRPTAPFRLSSPSSVQYIPGYAPEVSMDFVEAIV